MKLSVPLKKAECFAKQLLSDVINALAYVYCVYHFLLAELNGYQRRQATVRALLLTAFPCGKQ